MNFNELTAVGSEKSLMRMKEIIPLDRSSFLREARDDLHIVSRRDSYGRRPINIACQMGKLKTVIFLIEQGCLVQTEFLNRKNTKSKDQDAEIPL